MYIDDCIQENSLILIILIDICPIFRRLSLQTLDILDEDDMPLRLLLERN